MSLGRGGGRGAENTIFRGFLLLRRNSPVPNLSDRDTNQLQKEGISHLGVEKAIKSRFALRRTVTLTREVGPDQERYHVPTPGVGGMMFFLSKWKNYTIMCTLAR